MQQLSSLKEEARLAIYLPRTNERDGLRRFDIDFPSIVHPVEGAPFGICKAYFTIQAFRPSKAGDILLSLVPSSKGQPGAHKMQEIGKRLGIVGHPRTRIEVRENTGPHISFLINFLEKYILDHLAQPLLFPSREAVYQRQKKVLCPVKVDLETKIFYLYLPDIIQ